MYVTDAGNDRVERFDAAGNYVSQFGASGSGNGQFSVPFGVAVDPASGDVYVTDQVNERVERFDAAGNYVSIRQLGLGQRPVQRSGRGRGRPASGDVYVTDQNNERVERFDAAGNYISQFGSSARATASSAVRTGSRSTPRAATCT